MCKMKPFGNLNWFKTFSSGEYIPSENITVISKCGYKWKENAFPPGVNVQYMNNVGREGHTYVSWMVQNYDNLVSVVNNNNNINNNENVEHVILFMKDNNNGANMQTKTLSLMKNMAISDGFACLFDPIPGTSMFHITKDLKTFKLDKYTSTSGGSHNEFRSKHGTDLGEFTQQMNITLPPVLTPVCYRGHFATVPSQIIQYPKLFWVNLEKVLGRADNLEEGHYMERLWGGILAKPLFKSEEDAEYYMGQATGVVEPYSEGRVGCLKIQESVATVQTMITTLGKPNG